MRQTSDGMIMTPDMFSQSLQASEDSLVEMAPTEDDNVRVVHTDNTVTVADSVKIVVEGQKSPTKVNVSKTKTISGKISMLSNICTL